MLRGLRLYTAGDESVYGVDQTAAENNQANELREVHRSGSGVRRMHLGCCDTYSTYKSTSVLHKLVLMQEKSVALGLAVAAELD